MKSYALQNQKERVENKEIKISNPNPNHQGRDFIIDYDLEMILELFIQY